MTNACASTGDEPSAPVEPGAVDAPEPSVVVDPSPAMVGVVREVEGSPDPPAK
jgi:hypothetical protein